MTEPSSTSKDHIVKCDQGSVIAPLTYTLKRSEKLVYLITEMGEDEDSPEYHKWYEVHDTMIRNARRADTEFSLDREGFTVCRAKSHAHEFYYSDNLTGVYDREIEKLVMDETGANRVMVFDHTIRVADEKVRRERRVRETVNLVHNDYTEKSGFQRVQDLLPEEEAGMHEKTRFAIFNLWRSIAGTVFSSPLALLDAHSVSTADWVACDLDYGDRMGEIYNVAFNHSHRWYYFPRMTTDEVLLFKNFDSVDDGRARFTPHTAFDDPSSPPSAPHRESIESRVLAFFTDDEQIT